MVLTLAMSFAVTSSIVWWFFKPLIAANMLRIMGASTPCLEDLGDRGGIDAVGPPDGQGRLAVGGRHTLHLAGRGLVVLALVGDRAPDQAHGLAEGEVVGHRLVGGGHVGDLLERREL